MVRSSRPVCAFVVESGTDVRLAEGLAERLNVTFLLRKIVGGVEISHPPRPPVAATVGPASRARFSFYAGWHVWQNRDRLDSVIVQGYGLAALVVNAVGRLTGIPTTMLVCSPVEEYYRCRLKQPGAGKTYRWWQAALFNVVARLNGLVGQRYIVLSEYLAGVVARTRRRQPVDVIPVYGVDVARFAPATVSKAALRRALGLPDAGSVVFFSSRIAPEKDSETLLRAVADLLSRGANIWVLHRSGGFREFARRASELGIGHRVIATDAVHPVTDLPRDYQASDLCVQASLEEGLGFSPLEALACEVPVVASAVGGLRETIVDGVTGWTYPVGNAAALANCIEEALGDPDEAQRRARNGRRLVASHFSRQLAFDRFVSTLPLRRCDRNPQVTHRAFAAD